ncbi:heat-inducible transcription repressor HrcA [Sporosarcina luteola]|uniref:Heat-inducible transcription repressor HrcA n=1 Tax=Sporosarcina luteola TaxID=582850 RepID=A0A511ZB65_9BACL|nr:heat-inducible transcriptional repressor HrcA [Sporosarcina luteola]GEN84643.1 heat-inducible transcription repressor HrcA [Sporosarcina luteola]
MLTNRQLLILQLTVNDFIESAQPVGSRQLSKKPEAPFSPATIRNDMADLEELGYLEKTHTSSGRVPSEKGYRFYVDHLLTPEKLTIEDSVQLRSIFQDRVVETEELIRNSAKIISELTNYTSILLGPDMSMHSVKRFSIVPLDETKAVAIIVTDNGHVENRVFDVPKGMMASDIEKMVNILNERLVGTPLSFLQNKLAREAKTVFEQHVHHAGDLFASFQRAMTIKPEERLYFGGKMNMLKQPEFNDLQKMKMFFELIENGTPAIDFFQDATKGIHVRIGSENKNNAMEDCSVITANYSAGNNMAGSIAIIGPKRMDYGKVITMLDILSVNLSHALNEMSIGLDRRKEQ